MVRELVHYCRYRVHCLCSVSENKTLRELLEHFLHPVQSDPIVRHR